MVSHMNQQTNEHATATAFIGGSLIDGCGGPVVHDSCVLVEGETIRFAGPRTDSHLPERTRQVDITGMSILPGLIDAHVHVGNIALQMEETANLSPAVYVLRASRNLESDIGLGFTTLRDAAGMDCSFIDAIAQGLIRGPRLFLSVSPLTPTGGHFDMRGVYGDLPVARNRLGIYPAVCDGPDAVRKAARDALRRGANQIKVAADGGVDSPSDQPGHWQFSAAELKAAVEVAEAAGTYVMAHAYSPRAIENCLDAGVRSIEHGNLLDEKTAARMAAAGAYLVPTLTVYDIMANEARGGMAPYAARKLDAVAIAGRDAVRIAREAGVKIASGSDILGPYQHLKGRELRIKAELTTPMEAIVSATRTNARMLNMGDRIGTLETGKSADLIVMDGDPLGDPGLFERTADSVVLVLKAGEVMKDQLTGAGGSIQ
jgi:imidazolonepropionase-like amidohydrolase